MPTDYQLSRSDYYGYPFRFAPIIKKGELPFFKNRKLSKYKKRYIPDKDNVLTNLLAGNILPYEVFHFILEYLINDPISLQHLSMVSRQCLSAIMQAVELNDGKKWYPFVQTIYETRRKTYLEKKNLCVFDYIQECCYEVSISKHEQILAKTSSQLFHQRIDFLLKKKDIKAQIDSKEKKYNGG